MKQQLAEKQLQKLQSLGYPYGGTLGELIQFLSERWPSDFNILKYTSGWQVGTKSKSEWEMLRKKQGQELIEVLYEVVLSVFIEGR